jgi:hypothetical protein
MKNLYINPGRANGIENFEFKIENWKCRPESEAPVFSRDSDTTIIGALMELSQNQYILSFPRVPGGNPH